MRKTTNPSPPRLRQLTREQRIGVFSSGRRQPKPISLPRSRCLQEEPSPLSDGEPLVIVNVIERPITSAPVGGEYEELSGTFANACREADSKRRQQQARQSTRYPDRPRLPKSTADAIDWLLAQKDERRIQKFLQGRTRENLTSIRNYILWKASK